MNQIKFNNNWENYEFWIGDKEIKHLNKISISGHIYDVEAVPVYNRVYDHGHEYDVTSRDFMIKLQVPGFPKEVEESLSNFIRKNKDIPVYFVS